MTTAFAPQMLDMLPTEKRIFFDRFTGWQDIEAGKVHTIEAAPKRSVTIKPFELIDPDGTCPADIRQYAAGRTGEIPPAHITFARNLRICGNGLVANEAGEILQESSIRPHHAYPRADNRVEIHYTKPVGRITRRIAEPAILVHGVFGLHFSHWFYDNYSRLTFLRRHLKSFAGYKLAVCFGTRRGGWCKPGTAQYASLEMLGFTAPDIVMIPEHDWFAFDKAIVLSEINNFKPPTAHIWNAPEIFEFYDEVFHLAGLARRKPFRRANLSRVADKNRKCVNEQDVVDLTNSMGFEHGSMAGLPLSEQMQYFSDIDVLAGAFGNNLMTLFAMQPGSRIVTFFPPHAAYVMAYYQSYCSALGIELSAVCGSNQHWEGQPGLLNNLRWDVNVDAVRTLVEKACKTPA